MTTAHDPMTCWITHLSRWRRRRRARRKQAVGIREHWAYWRARGWLPWSL